MRRRVLVLDDEVGIVNLIAEALGDDGLDVVAAHDLASFERVRGDGRYDLYMIDLGLPDGNGLEIIAQLRQDGDGGIIILSGRSAETDRVVGLEIGADDYISKPFRIRELVARVHAVLRRTQPRVSRPRPEPLPEAGNDDANVKAEFEGLLLDFDARQLFDADGADIPLTTSEFNLLAALVRHRGQVLNRDQLMNAVKGRDWESYDRAVDGLISRLRQKIPRSEGGKSCIRTVHGVGYAFAASIRWSGRR